MSKEEMHLISACHQALQQNVLKGILLKDISQQIEDLFS